jgi:hypothetical protein
MMIPSVTANTGPPSSRAVEVDAAIGTLVAVATRKIRRTERLLPETAFADQVSSCHGSHSNANSSATLPAPLQVGASMSRPTSCEKARTYAKSKKSSTGSAVKSSVRSGSGMPFTSEPRR